MVRKKVLASIMIATLCIGLCSCGKKEEKTSTEDVSTESTEGEAYYEDEYGDKFALGQEGYTPEDIVYYYVKSLSTLDFSSAQKFVYSSSSVISGYNDLNSSDVTDDSILYSRKMFKLFLNSLLVNKINDTVTMDDQRVVNFDMTYIDYESPKFYEENKKEVFKKLDNFYNDTATLDTSAKAYSYLYNYVYQGFSDMYADGQGDYPKATSECELNFSKNSYGNWVISDDYSIYSLCCYYNGSELIERILAEYNEMVEQREQEEAEEEARKQVEAASTEATN